LIHKVLYLPVGRLIIYTCGFVFFGNGSSISFILSRSVDAAVWLDTMNKYQSDCYIYIYTYIYIYLHITKKMASEDQTNPVHF
jgi:hypothetical protein